MTETQRVTFISSKLKELIYQDGRTQAELSKACSISQSVISKIINGYRPDPRISTVMALMYGMGRTMADLDKQDGD
jgi:transcriptional regulator with XRE-family HTH domain